MHEAAHQIIDLYQRHAQTWDRIRSRHLVEQSWLDRFRQAMPVADGHVLDIGCGCAEPMAGYLINAGHAVCGIDSSMTMIALCRQRFPQHGALPICVSWRLISVMLVFSRGTVSFT